LALMPFGVLELFILTKAAQGPFRVNRFTLAMCWSLPIFPYEQTSSASVGMSQKCQTRKSTSLAVSGTPLGRHGFKTSEQSGIPPIMLSWIHPRRNPAELK
jgi:hypothetical protein